MIGVQRLRDIYFLLICYRTGQTVMAMIRVSTDTMTFILTSLTLPKLLTAQTQNCGTQKVVHETLHKSSYLESSGLFISSNVLQSFLQISLIVAFIVFHFFFPLLTAVMVCPFGVAACRLCYYQSHFYPHRQDAGSL